MPDYGNPLRFGVFPAPDADRLDETMATVRAAEHGGLDLVGIQDHPYQRRHLDAWALMATILARTERVSVFPDVANLPLRPPAVMAETAASLDVLSGGRFELGLGAGAFRQAVSAMGGPSRTPPEAAGALEEAVEVIRLMWWQRSSVRYDGRHYRLAGVKPGPPPAHDIGIWLGVGGPRMLAAAGRLADGWVPSSAYFPPEKLPAMAERIDAAAREAGRDPAAVRRIYNVMGTVDGSGAGSFQGPAHAWVEEFTRLAVEVGMDTFVFAPDQGGAAQVERFAAEIAPAVRGEVARLRGSG
ncbi:LLM class flavin-dependent oxidoreductase [Streptomonospora litoralis]|uniref:Phthiodiolone/phenolphthiodiolone dimycocerosates ketoreductase n=1 Tax=Streptomonospora litoralis TaxID=2498135 RepID=A0A4P6Q0Q2_9ACTN|nr:LLM class flavin-dependent oxidoreductase [Streptomonospora litoralis]QBI54013.1 Phthiodiolone/phenolphthiodiolone dimycocerosates ketoreductase [Streptomonospora litoralis]